MKSSMGDDPSHTAKAEEKLPSKSNAQKRFKTPRGRKKRKAERSKSIKFGSDRQMKTFLPSVLLTGPNF